MGKHSKKPKKRTCEGCGGRSRDVAECGPYWDAGGDRIGDFYWVNDGRRRLFCEACDGSYDEEHGYRTCDRCGAKYSTDYADTLAVDANGQPLCPKCSSRRQLVSECACSTHPCA
jgi:hypothetical protein